MVHVIQSPLRPYASFALAQGVDPPPHRRDMLTDGEVHALEEGRVDLPPTRGEDLLDGFKRTEHHAVMHPHQAPAPYGLAHLRREQLGPRQPARRRDWPCRLTARWLPPRP